MTPPDRFCPHCRRRYVGSPHEHIAPSAPTPHLVVGQQVTALIDTDVCRVGQVGTVTDEHASGSRYWTIWFDGGLMDYWNPCQVGLSLRPSPLTGQFVAPVATD